MVKSKPVPIRFSLDELKIIQEFMKKYELKSMNDAVRYSVAMFIGMLEGYEKLIASGYVEQIEAWQNSLRDEVSKKKSLKKFGEAFKVLDELVLPKIESKLAEGAKIVKPFAEKKRIR